MMRHPTIKSLLAICLLTGAVASEITKPEKLAKKILDMSGVQGGLVVHLGCGDGKLTAALHADESYTVHGLVINSEKITGARQYICEQGLYGPVSVETFSGSILPYTDNLINLIVVENAGQVGRDEIIRVLAPGGVACTERNGQWNKIVKPWPNNIDQWTHFLHDASNNAVADDTVVGPPRSLQWVAPPLWLRSHETPSGIQCTVSSAGRIFYFFDEGLIGITDERLPDRWTLVCRDAFNGKLLWKRPLESWGWREWDLKTWQGKDWTTVRGGRTKVPNENQRRMVADGDRIYTTLTYRAPMSILNAATGDIIATVEATRHVSEILVSNEIVIAYTRNEPEDAARRRGAKEVAGAKLVAVDGQTAKVLWQKQIDPIRSLALAINNGRIVHLSGNNLVARSLKSGKELWRIRPKQTRPKTLVTVDDTIVLQGGKFVTAYDATNGALLWDKTVSSIAGGEGDDLFVIDGLVWRGIVSVDDEGKPVRKSPNALVIGWDLRSGEEKKRILVKDLRSPEHHHRCYRNKATLRYLISSYEGAEFLDFQADDHSQNNWIRGACKYGMVPCNGMLYVPPDQCFCQPGAKLLGYTALTTGQDNPLKEVPDTKRLEKGSAYRNAFEPDSPSMGNWPTFRHDPSRSGTTTMSVAPKVAEIWKTKLKGTLTPPVASMGKVFVAQSDTHTVYALNAVDGTILWHFTAGGRIDSPPTIKDSLVLFGSKDGYVYCLRAADGVLVWRFLAAPRDRRIAFYDQIESAWPVHGSVLLHDGIAYFTAGRSTYLDGGIHVYGLDPVSGDIRYKTVLKGPNPFEDGGRDVAFFILGANSDVLVSEGGYLYMRQKKLTSDLKEIEAPVFSSKGAQDVGLHIFSTSGLLDGSWYNRAFWMYSKRWPGFQLANQASKTGQLLVVDEKKTYAVRVFHRRNVHSPMFFPGKEGYLLFADLNTNEPQLVGEPGWRKPVAWLPQSHIPREGNPGLDNVGRGFGADKGIGYTRAEPPVWMEWIPVRIRAMVKAGETLFAAGPPDVLDPKDPYAAFEGRKGAKVLSISAENGKTLSEINIESPPVFDGLIAASGRLFASLRDGSVICMGQK